MRQLLVWGALSVAAGSAGADEAEHATRKRVPATRAKSAPRIDGRLDDACWSEALADDRFVQYAPETGAAPSERTTVQVCYDDKAIYVAVRAWDREPDGIVTRLARRDRVVEGDRIELLLDTRHDHHSGFLFLLTAAGGQADGFVANDGDFSTDWDAVWEGRTGRDAGGWTAEFAVPLAAVRFESEPEQLWGMQVLRYVSRRRESAVWSAIPRDRQALVSPLHHIQLGQLRPRRTFAALPFLLLRAEARGAGDTWLGLGDDGAEHDPGLSAGVDLKLGLTRALTLDASILPDFGQIEADEVVLNLTRFETFFPEKRPFFLEGADLFATPMQLFYSRRIGRAAEDGGSVPIWAAAKVTGTAHAAGMGVLAAVTGPEDDLGPAQGFAVARGRWTFAPRSHVGVIATHAIRLGGEDQRARRDHDAFAQSLDGGWRSGDGRLRLQAQVVLSERVGGETEERADGGLCRAGDSCRPIARADGTPRRAREVGWGAQVQAGYQAPRWDAGLVLEHSSSRLDLGDLGFFPAFGQTKLDFGGGLRNYKPDDFTQTSSFTGGGLFIWAGEGVPYQSALGIEMDTELRSGWYLRQEVWTIFPGTWDPYETGDGGQLEKLPGPGGELELSTDPRRRVSASFFAYGEFGLRGATHDASLRASVQWTPVPALELSFEPKIGTSGNQTRFYFPADGCLGAGGEPCTLATDERRYRFAELDSGYLSFTARASYAFTPRLSLTGYAQLFVARGAFSRYRTLMTDGARPRIRLGDLVPDSFAGDLDGDGVKDDDFQDTSLNLNAVLRWELRAGSTLQVVYARSQEGAAALAGERPRLTFRGLSGGRAIDLLLLKLSLYFA